MPATHNSRLRTLGQPTEPDGLALLRREFATKNRRLEETLLNLDNLISPADWLDAGDGFPGFGAWRWNRPGTRAQDRTHAPLSYLNEEEWRQHVALARDLVTRNHLALGFRDHVANFVGPVSVSFVLKGQTPGASASGPIDADGDGEPDIDPIVKEATQAWDEWRELAEWGEGEHDREAECRTRLIVEGECTLRFFVGTADSNGLPHVRHVEPELIRTPPGHDTTDSWGWGIKCAEDDDECEDALWLCRPDNPNDGREVRSSEYVRAKANVDRTVKRGLSDFFAVAEHLRKVLGLLDNMGHVARLQSAIAWWEQYPTATEAQVRAMIQSGADYSRPKVAPGVPARTSDVQNYEPGSIIRTEAGRQVQPGPVATGVAGYAQVEALLLRGVGFRWGCPSYFSGDADASFASVLVTGSPFVRITEARQEKVKGFARAVARRVLEFCERSGRLPRGTIQRVRPIATARPVVIADEEKQARTFLALYQQKCADPIEFVRKRGGDPKVVAANILAWQKKFAPPDQPPGGAGAGPGNPFPSPPGSAGGDGTSPNAPPVGESRRVRENYNEADHPRDDHGRWVHKDDIQAAKSDPTKADELRGRVTNPAERAKLDALLSSNAPAAGTPDATTDSQSGPDKSPEDDFNAEEIGKQLVTLLPSDEELDKIRKEGVPRGKDHTNAVEKRWEKVIALILGPGWTVSKDSNSPDDVSGTLTIDGQQCHIILDGKFTAAGSYAYDQDPESVQNKLKASAEKENTVVGYVVAYHLPTGDAGTKAADGVFLRFGVMPQAITVTHNVVGENREFGPFRILSADQFAKLRAGDAEAVQAFRKNVLDKFQTIKLDKYKEVEQQNDITQLGKTGKNMNGMAQASVKHKVPEKQIGQALAQASDALPEGVKVAQIGAVGEKLADEGMATAVEALGKGRSPEALQQAIARLQAILPRPADTPSPK